MEPVEKAGVPEVPFSPFDFLDLAIVISADWGRSRVPPLHISKTGLQL
jgi:hypothetical protein